MDAFEYYFPTKVHFGKEQLNALPSVLKSYGKRILLVYGKKAIKQNGIYDYIVNVFNENNLQFTEYQGIKSNPIIDDINEAARSGRAAGVDMILAVGGGSVIDSAKLISVSVPGETDAWNYMSGKATPHKAIPLITVLTLAATGSEMNNIAVISNPATQQKMPIRHPLLSPRHSFLNPEFTFSVNRKYTAYGIVDIIAHALEAYFGNGRSPLSDKFSIAIIREMMEIAKPLLNRPEDYELRARMMYAATNALNGLTLYGKKSGDWGVHALGHILSLMYDTPHGASLSIMYPAWLKCKAEILREPLVYLGKELFGENNPPDIIRSLERFFTEIESPVNLRQAGISADEKDHILRRMITNNVNGWMYPLCEKDLECILNHIV